MEYTYKWTLPFPLKMDRIYRGRFSHLSEIRPVHLQTELPMAFRTASPIRKGKMRRRPRVDRLTSQPEAAPIKLDYRNNAGNYTNPRFRTTALFRLWNYKEEYSTKFRHTGKPDTQPGACPTVIRATYRERTDATTGLLTPHCQPHGSEDIHRQKHTLSKAFTI